MTHNDKTSTPSPPSQPNSSHDQQGGTHIPEQEQQEEQPGEGRRPSPLPRQTSSSILAVPSSYSFVTGRILAAELEEKRREQRNQQQPQLASLKQEERYDAEDNDNKEYPPNHQVEQERGNHGDNPRSAAVLFPFSDTRSGTFSTPIIVQEREGRPQQAAPLPLDRHDDAPPDFPAVSCKDAPPPDIHHDDVTVQMTGASTTAASPCKRGQQEQQGMIFQQEEDDEFAVGDQEEELYLGPDYPQDNDQHRLSVKCDPTSQAVLLHTNAGIVVDEFSLTRRPSSAGAASSSSGLLPALPPQDQQPPLLDQHQSNYYVGSQQQNHESEKLRIEDNYGEKNDDDDDDDDHNSMTSALDELEEIAMEQERIHQIRSIVRQEIEKRIKAKCSSLSSLDPRQLGCNPNMVESMSKRVEGQLYAMRESLESYIDLSTLDSRLQALALAKQQQQEESEQQQEEEDEVVVVGAASSSHKEKKSDKSPNKQRQHHDHHNHHHDPKQQQERQERTEQLVQVLGGIGRYRQIQTLLQEIREEQENWELSHRPPNHENKDDDHQGGSTSTTSTTSTSSSRSRTSGRKRKKMDSMMMMIMMQNTTTTTTTLPDPVKALYLETQELQFAFERVPMELLGTMDWTLMIARTQAVLRAFREWNGDVTA